MSSKNDGLKDGQLTEIWADVNLDLTEIRERGQTLARVLNKIKEIEREFESARKKHKSEMQELESQREGLAEAISTGIEYQRISVRVRIDLDEKMVFFIDPDTLKIIDKRDMTQTEWDINSTQELPFDNQTEKEGDE